MSRHDLLFFALLLLAGAVMCVPELLRLAFPAECPVPAAPIETLLGERS
ncbi:hypothetical protein Xaut_4516 [Xanthobacter versatilis]|uniref:Uncharacterized protein n=1 Tax=Xanthobacter autotrophicus (strain ATCC BAA-1158 / Py2) TaxID=78245 RepID=A7INZ1_XANP2|nr:hypothetical protein Xaut_4516 [Xanthobacter autotrophicus Py2]